jgi:hypothetical protein
MPSHSVVFHRMKDAFAQERKSGPAVALSFDQFEFGHMALDHAVVDRPGEACLDSLFVFLDARSEGLQFSKVACLDALEPSTQAISFSLADHCQKILSQLICLREFWACQAEHLKCLLFDFIELFRLTDKEPDCCVGGKFL